MCPLRWGCPTSTRPLRMSYQHPSTEDVLPESVHWGCPTSTRPLRMSYQHPSTEDALPEPVHWGCPTSTRPLRMSYQHPSTEDVLPAPVHWGCPTSTRPLRMPYPHPTTTNQHPSTEDNQPALSLRMSGQFVQAGFTIGSGSHELTVLFTITEPCWLGCYSENLPAHSFSFLLKTSKVYKVFVFFYSVCAEWSCHYLNLNNKILRKHKNGRIKK